MPDVTYGRYEVVATSKLRNFALETILSLMHVRVILLKVAALIEMFSLYNYAVWESDGLF